MIRSPSASQIPHQLPSGIAKYTLDVVTVKIIHINAASTLESLSAARDFINPHHTALFFWNRFPIVPNAAACPPPGFRYIEIYARSFENSKILAVIARNPVHHHSTSRISLPGASRSPETCIVTRSWRPDTGIGRSPTAKLGRHGRQHHIDKQFGGVCLRATRAQANIYVHTWQALTSCRHATPSLLPRRPAMTQ